MQTQQQFREAFAKKMNDGMKQMTSDGIRPHSPFWKYGKLLLMRDVAKEMGINIKFEEDGIAYDKTGRTWPFNSYKMLLLLNRVYEFKRQFKRFHTIDGHKFWVKPSPKMMDIVDDYLCLTEGMVWEYETTRIVKEEVKEGMTCVDIGASVGYFTLLFSRQVGETGKVVAIEPTDFQQPYLAKNIKTNGYKDRVTQVHAGAWHKDEIVKMPRSAPPYVQTELRCRPVDDILEELGILHVDFIKMDVDGPEPKVLRGLERTFQRNPNLKMVCEFYPKYIEDAGLDPDEFWEVINKYFTYEVIPGDYSDGCWNYICTRK